MPRYILVSDFARFRLYDLEEDNEHEFTLKNLYKNVRLFGFVAGYQTTSKHDPDWPPTSGPPAPLTMPGMNNWSSASRPKTSADRAEDTSIFERRRFQDLIEQRTATDGLAQWLGVRC